jgi:hypothetical protein
MARKRATARKIPLRLASDPVPAISPAPQPPPAAGPELGRDLTPLSLRTMMITEFCEFQEGTIAAYSDAAIALSA